MKKYFFLLFFIIHGLICSSQGIRPFQISLITRSNIKAKIDTISINEFRNKGIPIKYNPIKEDSNILSITGMLRERHPNSFIDSSHCIIFNGLKERVNLCIDTSSKDTKGWTSYSIINYEKNFLIARSGGWEWRSYILFNPETRQIKIIDDYPVFIDSKAVYAVGNDYGDGFFEYLGLIDDTYFGFSTSSWAMSGYYRLKNKFYFEFTSTFNRKFQKYISVDISNLSKIKLKPISLGDF